SASCNDAVQATLDEVLVEVQQLEREGAAIPDARAICIDEPDESTEDVEGPIAARQSQVSGDPDEAGAVQLQPDLSDPGAAVLAAERHSLSAEEAITTLRGK